MDVSTSHLPSSLGLIPGTVTRTFYDTIPYCDTLGVHLCPGGVRPTYTRGRVAAVVSDVRAVFDADGSPIKASDKTDSVIRVTSVYSYDKYGRVVANFYSDPTMPVDSLETLAVTTQYDLGGKVIAVMKYPYGINGMSWTRNVVENYIYDRLGRISAINTKNGGASTSEIVRYEYYPTGSVKTVTMGNSVTLTYTYHISGAVKTATIQSADGKTLYADTLYYEDCNGNGCTPQYNGNISRMVHELAHGNDAFAKRRDVKYTYDLLNRLTRVDDAGEDYFDEYFAYDEQGRIVAQRRDTSIAKNVGGEYTYESGTNRLKSVAMGMGGTADERPMSDADNFVYDRDGRLVEDRSKHLTITYDWRGMPVEFKRETACNYHGHPLCDSTKLVMDYDGTGRRISKTRARKEFGGDWETELVTHYTGIGTEVRENPVNGETKVVVNLPNGLGRYMPEDASAGDFGFGAGYMPPEKFEWYLKNHLGSTMLVYGTQGYSWTDAADVGSPIAAYDYRAFGEQVSLAEPSDKVTETFTGKELDDETGLSNHGARLLDPMLGVWISVDPKRFFPSPYLYMGNGYNPIRFADLNGEAPYELYGSLNAAAQDFAKLYNGLSIASDKEYGTIFYRKGDSYSYVNPTRGRTGSVNLSACVFEARTKGYQIVSSGHTHGRLTDEYGVKQEGFLEPSDDDYISEFTDENYTPYKENPLDPAYVVVPNGNLLKYGLDGVDVVPTEGIASDPIYQYDVDLLPEP